jgi:hypothetical protein
VAIVARQGHTRASLARFCFPRSVLPRPHGVALPVQNCCRGRRAQFLGAPNAAAAGADEPQLALHNSSRFLPPSVPATEHAGGLRAATGCVADNNAPINTMQVMQACSRKRHMVITPSMRIATAQLCSWRRRRISGVPVIGRLLAGG